MSKEDYRDKIEEHRQSFEEEEEQGTLSRASRVKRNGGPNKKPKNTQRKTPLMTILVIIFILIPSMILIFVWMFYEPGKTVEQVEQEQQEQESTGSIIEVAKPGDETGDKVTTDKEDKATDDKATDDKEAQEQAKKDAEMLAAQDKVALEAKKAEEARKALEAKKAEEAKLAQQKAAQQKAAEEAKRAEEARKAQESAAANAKTHTVKANENLYRIALNYYGDGSEATLAKIRAANGMSSDTVMLGQVIKLP